mgnify:CR=1 FL=1
MKNFCFLSLFAYTFAFTACGEGEFLNTAEPVVYYYSGEFMLIDENYLELNGERFPNNLGEGVLQISLSQQNDLIYFKIEGKGYGIFEIDIYRNATECLIYNETEIITYEIDKRGNDLITVIMEEDFYKKCYSPDKIELPLNLNLKSIKPIF